MAHKDLTHEFWSKVLFSDETCIAINLSTIMNQIRRTPGSNCFDERYTRKTVKHPLTVMFWGCFSRSKIGSLIPINGYMNSMKYLELLKDKLKANLQTTGSETFQNDSAPCHRAKIIKEYFSDECISQLTWPGNSPDINPIENLWPILKRRLKRRTIKSRQALIYLANYEWERIPSAILENLIDSMPKRINAVICQRGGLSKY